MRVLHLICPAPRCFTESRNTNLLLALAPGSILGIGAPLVLEELLSYSSTVLSLGFAGRLGPAALSAFTLAHAVTNISGDGGGCWA